MEGTDAKIQPRSARIYRRNRRKYRYDKAVRSFCRQYANKRFRPINTPKRTGIVGAMRLDGTIRYRSFEGSITGKRFLIFLKQTLLPVLRKGDIVIMNNLSIHKVKGVQELILSAVFCE